MLVILAAMGWTALQAQGSMRAVFSYSTFYAPSTSQPYVETYLSFDAWTMQFVKQPNGSYRATAEVTIVAKHRAVLESVFAIDHLYGIGQHQIAPLVDRENALYRCKADFKAALCM